MADEVLGNLAVQITGDYSELQTAVDGAAGLAAIGADTISAAFAQPDMAAPMTASVEDLSAAVSTATGEVAGLGAAGEGAAPGLEHAGTSAHEAGGAFSEMGESAKGLLESLTEIAALAGVSVGLAEIAKEAIEAYSAVQLATVSLTALTGSASGAATTIEHLKTVAQSDALSFPQLVQAQQRMTAMGFSADESASALQSIADASKAVGNNFDAVASSFDRIALSGTASARTLVQLGLSMSDLAGAMGVTDGEAKKVFASLDMEDRITVLNEALAKFSGVASAAADTVAGHWTQFQNALDFAFEDIGAASAPALTALLSGLQSLIPVVQAVSTAFAGNLVQQLNATVEAMKALGSTIAAVVGPLDSLRGAVKGLDLGSFSSDVVNAMTHLRDLADIINLTVLAYDKMRGNQQGALEAAQRLAQAHGLLAESTKAAADTATAAAGAVTGEAQAHIQAALAALQKNAATELWTKTSAVALAIVKESVAAFKDYNDALSNSSSESEFGIGLDKLIEKLSKTKQAMLDDTTSGYNWHLQIGLLTDDINRLAAGGLLAAQASMDALAQRTSASTTATGDADKALLSMGRTIRVLVDSDLKDYVAIANARLKLDGDILTNTKAYDAFLKAEHIPTFATLADALANLDTLHQQQITDSAKLQDALAVENALRESGSTDVAAMTAAEHDAKAARDDLGASTAALNQAESDLQTNYGLSKDASILMANTMNDEGAAAQNLALAYAVLGEKTTAMYKALADAAHTAYEKISQDANASHKAQLDAAIKDKEAEVQLYENTGSGSVPAALQIQLARMKQEQTDYANDTQKQWSNLYSAIDTETQNLFKSMTTTLFTGKGSFHDEAISALESIGASVLTAFVKPFEDLIARLMAGAIANLLGSSGIGGITAGLSQIGQFFGFGGSAAAGLGGAGSATAGIGAAGAGSGSAISAISSTISTTFTTITSAITAISSAVSAVTGIIGLFQQGHMESDLQKIEASTRYMAIYMGGQDESLLWCAQQTQGNTNLALDELRVIDAQVSTSRETLGYILGQLVLISGYTAGSLEALKTGVPTGTAPGGVPPGAPSAPAPYVPTLPGTGTPSGGPHFPGGPLAGNPRGGAGGTGAGDVNIYINVPGTGNPAQTAKAIAQHLRTISPKFSGASG